MQELALSEKLKAEAEMSWEEKLRQTQQIAEQREQMLSMMQARATLKCRARLAAVF